MEDISMEDIPSVHSPPRSSLRRAHSPDSSELQLHGHRDKIMKTTLQITVDKISDAGCLPCTDDLRVGVCVDGLTKLTCVGDFDPSESMSVITWNHPFTFTGSLSSTVSIYLCTLPRPVNGWTKELIGEEIKLDASQLLQGNPVQDYCVLGLHGTPKLHINVNSTTSMVREEIMQGNVAGLMMSLRQLIMIAPNISKAQQWSCGGTKSKTRVVQL
ncbi:hypothetical protein HYDPIDRAFT_31393 [Hydnomerulius pinastri MD-312]|uniref:C2 domain-containing protein n=1 Tax=Hydnomerulius pinastri MD-312 TaxID=994086 RepID=A0A0C9WC11_9AGAM|nr:hypothetical protein HYDPIDRAFT_31393 [Hydnomerulius pinastri MD-312]